MRDATAAALAGVALPPKGRPAASGARSLGTRVLPVFVLSLESWASGGDDDDGYADHLLFERALARYPLRHCIPCGMVYLMRHGHTNHSPCTPHAFYQGGAPVPKQESCYPTPHGSPGRMVLLSAAAQSYALTVARR